MKKCVLIWCLVGWTVAALGQTAGWQDAARSGEQAAVAFWNLENYFDPVIEHPDKPRWTATKFYSKADMFGKTMLAMPSVPLAIGVCEIENEKCVRALVRGGGVLAEAGYRYSYVHFDSPDRRGIDVALLYRKDAFRLAGAEAIRVREFATRDILHAVMVGRDAGEAGCGPAGGEGAGLGGGEALGLAASLAVGDTVEFFVCHFPSQISGASSGDRREIVAAVLDSALAAVPAGRKIVVMGDFNSDCTDKLWDTIGARRAEMWAGAEKAGRVRSAEDAGSERSAEEAGSGRRAENALANKAMEIEAKERGSHKFQGTWSMLDNFFCNFPSRMVIFSPEFLLEQDKAYGGMKPRRTYIGPRYNGGVSDHLPVMLIVE